MSQKRAPDRPPLPVAELASLAATLEDVEARLVRIANELRGKEDGDAISNELFSVESALRQGSRRLSQLVRRERG